MPDGLPYCLRVSSQKGGVGKTTISVNIAIALRLEGFRVLLIDGDTSNPSVGFHLGLYSVNVDYSDVLGGRATLRDAVAVHAPTGLHVLPGKMRSTTYVIKPGEPERLRQQLGESSYDFVVFDTAPGFVAEESASSYDMALIVTTPEMSSCASSARLAKYYASVGLDHNMVVNMFRNRNYEVTVQEIEEMYGKRVLGVLPEDNNVPVGISEHIPVCLHYPNSAFSKGLRRMVLKHLATKAASPEMMQPRGILGRALAFLRHLLGL